MSPRQCPTLACVLTSGTLCLTALPLVGKKNKMSVVIIQELDYLLGLRVINSINMHIRRHNNHFVMVSVINP